MCDRRTVYALSRLIPNCFAFNGLCDDEFQPFVNVDKFLNIKYIIERVYIFGFPVVFSPNTKWLSVRANEPNDRAKRARNQNEVKVKSAPIKIATHWTSPFANRLMSFIKMRWDFWWGGHTVLTVAVAHIRLSFACRSICVQFLGGWSATFAKHVRFLIFFFGRKGANKWLNGQEEKNRSPSERQRGSESESQFDDMLARTLMSLLQTDILPYSHMLTNFIRFVRFGFSVFPSSHRTNWVWLCVCMACCWIFIRLFFFGCFNVEFPQNSKNH